MKKWMQWFCLFAGVFLMGTASLRADASERCTVTVPGKRFYTVADQAILEINQKRVRNGHPAFKTDGNLMEMAMQAAAGQQTGSRYFPEGEVSCAYQAVRLTSYLETNLYGEASTTMKEEVARIVSGCESLTEGWDSYDTIGIGCFAAMPGEFLNNNVGVIVLLGKGDREEGYQSPGRIVSCQEAVTVDTDACSLVVSGKKNATADGIYDVMKKGESKMAAPALVCRDAWKQVNLERVPYQTVLSSAGASVKSSAPSVVSVGTDGMLKAETYGTAVVTVRLGPWTASRKIVVADGIGSSSLGTCYPVFTSKSHIPAGYSGKCSVNGSVCTVKKGTILSGKTVSLKSKGKQVKKGGAYYRILSVKKRTVQYQKPVRKTAPSSEIPTTVTIGGKPYRVVAIKANAFRECHNLTRVTIGTQVRTIGSRAFYGCSRLRKIVVKTRSLTKRTVGKQAFGKIHPKATVKVPAKKLLSYRKLFHRRGIGKKGTIKK